MFTVALSEADYLQAQRLHNRRRNTILRYVLLGETVILVVLVLLALLAPTAGLVDLALIVGALLLFTLLVLLWLPNRLLERQGRKLYAQQTTLHLPYAVDVSDEALTFTNERGATRSLWSDFRKWKHDGGMVVLYPADNLMQMVPLRGLPTEAARAEFLALVQARLGAPGL